MVTFPSESWRTLLRNAGVLCVGIVAYYGAEYPLGEEFMYRGILLPKMNGVFGKWDWFFNGILFGLYHLHKPQIILSTALYFGLVFALPSKLFQSSWMAVFIHGLEGVLGLVMILGIILGLS